MVRQGELLVRSAIALAFEAGFAIALGGWPGLWPVRADRPLERRAWLHGVSVGLAQGSVGRR
jgi:hypothetical protein